LADILGILSLCIAVSPLIQSKLANYLKKKEAKEELLKALTIRIDDFQVSFQKVVDLPRDKVIPLLNTLENRNPTVFDMEELRKGSSEVCYAYAYWVDSFVALAKGFNVLYKATPAFMEQLKNNDKFLYDFVFQMASMYKANHLEINEDFFLFTELYKKKLKSIYGKNNEIEELIDEAKKDIELAKKRLVPYRNLTMSRKITATYFDALRELRKASQKIRISKEISKNLDHYILPSLKPLIPILNQASFDKHLQ
jgi:hypothetical protein